MKIACLGWGSLIWRPENLLIRREWFKDGPFLPIEFVRKSSNGRLTLVIADDFKPVRTLWSVMATEDLYLAKDSLRVREGISKAKVETDIGSIVTSDSTTDKIKLSIQTWARNLNVEAVIWTNLPPQFNQKGDGMIPTLEDALNYIRAQEINTRVLIEEYIRKAPKQIDTDYRRKFESEFGWTSINTGVRQI